MKLPIIGILSGVALATLGLSGIAQAAIVVPPTGLAPGSEYRLVFVTSGTRDATSRNIADYNTFVQNAARSSSVLNTALTTAGFDPTSITWTAIASTATTNARVNTQTRTTDTSRPIYRLDGAQVATSYADLWDGSIANPILIDEKGRGRAFQIWTGTSFDGNASAPPSAPLGDSLGSVGFGVSVSSVAGWVSLSFAGSYIVLSVYGLSAPLTVQGTEPPASTPEPSSLLGFITLGGLMLGDAVRKARK